MGIQMNKKVGIKVIVGMVLCLSFLLCSKNMWNMGMLDVYAETVATKNKSPWLYMVSDGVAVIYGYKGNETEIEIPEEIDGYVVKEIDNNTFEAYEHLKSVTLPETLVTIGSYAFADCSSLESIFIPKNVTSCCSDAFYGCSSLASIVVDKENKVYDSRENCNALIEKSTNKLLFGCKNTVIPKGVQIIGVGAFYGCKELTSITIPDGVTEIEGWAFWGCKGLTSITIPDGVTEIGMEAFYECSGIKSIVFPDSVKKIGDNAFLGCSSLTSIRLSDGMTEIPGNVFNGCCNIESIYISANVKKIGFNPFSDCTKLSKIIVDEDNKFYDSRNNCNAIIEKSSKTLVVGCKNTVIPNGIKKIGGAAFSGCSGLKSIKIPKGVTEIERAAFSDCTGLTSITIPEGVTTLGISAFSGCSGLKSIKIPQSLTEMGWSVFSDCTGLTSITIPKGVTNLSDMTFYECKNLKSVKLPKGLKKIGNEAFYGCSSLKSVTIPQNVKKIGFCAFKGCSGLKSIEIPDSVTEIRFDAFDKIGKHFIVFSSENSCARQYANDEGIKWRNSNSDSIETFLISVKQTKYTYDGKGKKPSVVVEMGGKKLKSGTDYKVAYEDNVKVGTAKAIISGTGKYSGTVTKSFTINPGKVKELKQKSTYFSNAITLSWEKMPGVDGYKIYRATSENGTYKKIATVKKTTYKNTKLEPAKTYYYKVYAYKAKVKGEFSDPVAAGTNTKKPTCSITAGAGKATLTWKEVAGADGYEVYMKTGKSGKYKKAKTVKEGTTVYTKSKLAKGKNYSFKIRTYRLVSGKKIYSDWSKVKTVKMK